jgi:hypothetical protein
MPQGDLSLVLVMVFRIAEAYIKGENHPEGPI